MSIVRRRCQLSHKGDSDGEDGEAKEQMKEGRRLPANYTLLCALCLFSLPEHAGTAAWIQILLVEHFEHFKARRTPFKSWGTPIRAALRSPLFRPLNKLHLRVGMATTNG
jgi:hypothetical protein